MTQNITQTKTPLSIQILKKSKTYYYKKLKYYLFNYFFSSDRYSLCNTNTLFDFKSLVSELRYLYNDNEFKNIPVK